MKVIHKYRLEITDIQTINISKHAVILCVQVQRERVFIWYETDDHPKSPRDIIIIGTGNPMSEKRMRYIGTVQMQPFVWHVYEVIT